MCSYPSSPADEPPQQSYVALLRAHEHTLD
jgi:hypothetical protein